MVTTPPLITDRLLPSGFGDVRIKGHSGNLAYREWLVLPASFPVSTIIQDLKEMYSDFIYFILLESSMC